ncbi:hypothetical protein Btru_037967 [Bulinus truncatus]|nr:hypothetical protein Btru_037967 [Bulinus truncatus]
MFPKCQKKQLKFSTFHGANVRLSTDKCVAQGYYLSAHGQFILENELYPGQNFGLEFRGTGILKLQGFESKYQAEEWVRSKKTLGKGSIRIRTKKTLRYHVSVPSEGSSILLSTKRTDDRQDKLDGKILAFDIEYGDVIVMIWKELNSRSVQFDSTCHR